MSEIAGTTPAPGQPAPVQHSSTELLSAERRHAILAQRIAAEVRRGWRLESQMEFQAVLVKGHRPNHLLHLILSVLTLGLWVFVWIGVSLGGEQRRMIVIDEYGN